jgi:hypothetical protein
MTDDAIDALDEQNEPPNLFVQRGHLVRLRKPDGNRPVIELLDEYKLRSMLTRVANFVKTGDKGPKNVSPPMDIVYDVLALGRWPFPELEGIVEAPAMRRNGTVLDTPGYDTEAKLYYAPARGLVVPRIPTNPTPKEIKAALSMLRDELLPDFPFVDQASLANALALLMSPIVRPMIDGPTPLGLLDKPAPGTGASLFADIVSIIATGRHAAMLSAPEHEDEWRKNITSVLREGRQIIVYDNVVWGLASSNLAKALTSTTWSDRLLGKNQALELPQHSTWMATGNNLCIGGDHGRRSYLIRMDAKMERPEERRKFRHPLPKWAIQQRGRILAAILTLARAWVVAGRPAAKLPTMGGFDDWVETIGGILAFAGVEGFLGNKRELTEKVDEGALAWGAFGAALFETFGDKGVSAAEIASEARRDGSRLREALPSDLLGVLDSSRFTKDLGYALRAKRDRIFGDLRIEEGGRDGHTKVVRWRVMRGTAGNVSTGTYTKGEKGAAGGARSKNPPQSPASPATPSGSAPFSENLPDDSALPNDIPELDPDSDLPGSDYEAGETW